MFIHKSKSQLYQYFSHERHYIMFTKYFTKQHGGQTASSSTKVCIKVCSTFSDVCRVECENDPSCLQEYSNDYDECVNDC